MDKASLEATLRTLDIWLIVFGVFVAIGVVGESVVGFLHWRRGGELQTLQNAENLSLTNSVAETTARAKEAELALERFRAPRQLTSEQITRIQEKVKPFAPAEYAIGVSMDDPEQIHVSDLIAIALKLAGWKQVDWYSEPIGRTMWGKIGKVPVPGNVLISPAPQDKSDAAKSLVDALNAEGIVATLTDHPVLMPFPGIKIMIGKKL